ncbi:MAG: hypothetical protein K9H61_08340 [Bacteroidia bacterium]|nr:hypothetical protein [Bacteroidia bacterium]MCF8446991.1 hypothetical protein [Bacteroidia bacterium]
MNTTSSFINLLLEIDLGDFLTQNKHQDATQFLLGHKDTKNELNRLLADQLKIYPKAKNKLPTFTENHCWFTSKSYEQASSESSALYKSGLIGGEILLDLSGGLGVDDWAFSKTFNQIITLDPNKELNELVRLNFKKLGLNQINRLDTTAEDYLKSQNIPKFDWIFLDADRRPNEKNQFLLEDGTPNILELKERCFELSDNILLKLSPMIDLVYLQNTLPEITKIWILGDKSEVKEILVVMKRNSLKTQIELEAVVLLDPIQSFATGSKANETNRLDLLQENYFYEPHNCIIKAGLTEEYSKYLGLKQIGKNSSFYTSSILLENFIGRSFQILEQFEFSKSKLKTYLSKKALVQANITKRNFPLSVDEIRKSYKIKEGGKDFLFFTTLQNGQKWVYHCRK